jgi:hypothetical protein
LKNKLIQLIGELSTEYVALMASPRPLLVKCITGNAYILRIDRLIDELEDLTGKPYRAYIHYLIFDLH